MLDVILWTNGAGWAAEDPLQTWWLVPDAVVAVVQGEQPDAGATGDGSGWEAQSRSFSDFINRSSIDHLIEVIL